MSNKRQNEPNRLIWRCSPPNYNNTTTTLIESSSRKGRVESLFTREHIGVLGVRD